jgi:hypothetical protein
MMLLLEKEISLLVCKMEKVFPPEWFNAMKHFLVQEARVGGPEQFRWMYSQERELKNFKLQCATNQGLRGVLQRHLCVKRLRTFEARFSHVPTM